VGLFLLVGVASSIVVAATPVTPTPVSEQPVRSTHAADRCDEHSYHPPSLDREWDDTLTNAFDGGPPADWRGGRVVPIGGEGDCSLLVTDDETATLRTVGLNGTHGVVTGVLDLGANGSLQLVASNGTAVTPVTTTRTDTATVTPNATAPGTEDRRPNDSMPTIALSNDGPDYEPSVVAHAGNQSTRIALSSGRFFGFAIQLAPDGMARIAVWDADEHWDDEWDVYFTNVTGSGERSVRLHGRAFLDSIALGKLEPPEYAGVDQPNDDSDSPAASGPSPPDEIHEDDDLGPPSDFDDKYYENQESEGGGRVLIVLFFLLFGGAGAFFPYEVARFGEQIDAIGSKTPARNVEPTGWNVALTRIVSIGLVVFGLLIGVGAL
jgi:hypothetical protein